ncbi:hypothetical protein J3R83DRAFT_9932 [Lanmaoa asiatica]|nr:hypothetical protein J3R83DRAFT_9932 [Lanmaoa asiatica]
MLPRPLPSLIPARAHPKRKKDRAVLQANKSACDGDLTTGSDGLLKDVQIIDVNKPAKKGRAECTQDIDAHFSAPYLNLDNKKVRDCNACSKQLKKRVVIVDQTTTLRRHQQAAHEETYRKWAAENGFTSMLPMDTKCRREEEARQRDTTSSGTSISRQPSLDSHLVPAGAIIQFSDSAFCNAAIEWLVATDQPIHCMEHPTFQKLLDIVSRAPNKIKVPSHTTMCELIIKKFKINFLLLKKKLSDTQLT